MLIRLRERTKPPIYARPVDHFQTAFPKNRVFPAAPEQTGQGRPSALEHHGISMLPQLPTAKEGEGGVGNITSHPPHVQGLKRSNMVALPDHLNAHDQPERAGKGTIEDKKLEHHMQAGRGAYLQRGASSHRQQHEQGSYGRRISNLHKSRPAGSLRTSLRSRPAGSSSSRRSRRRRAQVLDGGKG
ncbi:uncharacterized protein [Triticum aestivum]|uniref:uncharacterized protein n=1 Tax=Triticum aestivum TaxID=4565 RepID=UPI001D02EED6|nr:uncharacterized protein LOC123134248 [Triticum aestivum]